MKYDKLLPRKKEMNSFKIHDDSVANENTMALTKKSFDKMVKLAFKYKNPKTILVRIARKRRMKEEKQFEDVTFNPYKLCPDWDKLNDKDRKVVFRWFSDRPSNI